MFFRYCDLGIALRCAIVWEYGLPKSTWNNLVYVIL